MPVCPSVRPCVSHAPEALVRIPCDPFLFSFVNFIYNNNFISPKSWSQVQAQPSLYLSWLQSVTLARLRVRLLIYHYLSRFEWPIYSKPLISIWTALLCSTGNPRRVRGGNELPVSVRSPEQGNVISALNVVIIHPKLQWLSSSHAHISARVG